VGAGQFAKQSVGAKQPDLTGDAGGLTAPLGPVCRLAVLRHAQVAVAKAGQGVPPSLERRPSRAPSLWGTFSTCLAR